MGTDEDRSWVVCDGVKSEAYDAAHNLTFSPDGRHLAFVARTKDLGLKRIIVVDGKRCDPVDGLSSPPLHFSPDSSKLGYGARIGDEIWWKVMKVKP